MSVIAKQAFATELKERLYDKLTTKDADTVIAELVEQLSGFDIEQLENEENSKDFEEMLNLYLSTLRMEGRKESTVRRYERELTKFHQYDHTPIRHITVFNIRQYLGSEKERGVSESTLRGLRDVFHAYFGWLHREGLLPMNPCGNLRQIKGRIEEREPFTDIELEKLRGNCITIKEKALISFLLSTGCRVGEVVSIDRKEVDFQNRCIKVCGKGEKERYVYFTEVTAMYLKQYLETRDDDIDALFVNKFRKRLTARGIEERIKNIGERAGVKKVFPHRFRHTFATNLIRNGMPIQEVAVLMGHSKIDTTKVYAHTNQDRVKLSYLRYS